jgi:hypothetical protein
MLPPVRQPGAQLCRSPLFSLERICAEIGVKRGDGKNPSVKIIAAKIIEHAQRGMSTQTALYLATMADRTPAD